MDPHSIFADPDPAVFLNADPDPERAYKTEKITSMVEKDQNIAQKLKAMELVHIYFIFKNISTIFTNKFICLVYYRLWTRINVKRYGDFLCP